MGNPVIPKVQNYRKTYIINVVSIGVFTDYELLLMIMMMCNDLMFT